MYQGINCSEPLNILAIILCLPPSHRHTIPFPRGNAIIVIHFVSTSKHTEFEWNSIKKLFA